MKPELAPAKSNNFTPPFYNTTRETGEILTKSHKKARSQDEIILDFFRSNPLKEFTPFEVQEGSGLLNCPATSIRRSITNLTKSGFLFKTENKKEGIYGKDNYCWKLFIHINPLGQISMF